MYVIVSTTKGQFHKGREGQSDAWHHMHVHVWGGGGSSIFLISICWIEKSKTFS